MNPSLPTINPKAPSRFDAIDPGVEYYARASFEDGFLFDVLLEDMARPLPRGAGFAIIEMPVIVEASAGTKFARARKSDVAATIFAAGSISRLYGHYEKVTVARWKGQIDKTTDHERTYKALTGLERSIIDRIKTKKQRGHIMDAVGIGLWYLWRK